MKSRITICSLIVLFSLAVSGPLQAIDNPSEWQPSASTTPKYILVLDSYLSGLPIPESIHRGIFTALREGGFSVSKVFLEHFDFARDPDGSIRRRMVNHLRYKLANKQIGMVITLGAPATDFIAQEGKALFPDAVVLALISPNNDILTAVFDNVISIPWHVDPAGTLNIALKLFPDTRRLFVVTGANDDILPFLEVAKNALSPWEEKLTIEYSNEMTYDEMLKHISTMPSDSIILYSPYFVDSSGKSFVPAEVVETVCQTANVPVFATLEEYLGEGIVGGVLLRTEDIGTQAGKVALDYLGGHLELVAPVTTFKSIPIQKFDWNYLSYWKADFSFLPEESIVNRPYSLWERFRNQVIVTSVVLLMLFLLLFIMLLINRKLKRVKENVSSNEVKLRAILENAPDAIFVRNKSCFTYLNPAALELFGVDSVQDLLGTPIIERYHPKIRDDIRERMRMLDEQHLAVPLRQSICLQMDGTEVNVESAAVPMNYQGEEGALVFMRNITDRLEDQKQRQLLEEQLHQSQKIESLGRLAGGVAHDYNNMLSVIIGNVELAKMRAERSAPVEDNLEQILQAANRSKDITRQLLAFARKQIINPKVLDLNDSIEDLLKMLGNLLRENIDLIWRPKKDLWPVKMDPSQLDQVLANLCINARDAIADVGKMTIETDKVSFDEDYCKDHLGFVPGNYVMIAVSDNGCGMDRETLDNIFEPFFTTKQASKGTGLGMATVYGIVKQSNGFINVYSELDQGTTFKIYLPRCDEEVVTKETTVVEVQKGRGETVLLVEDEIAIVQLTTAMLEDLGYRVLAVNSPTEALSLAKAQQGEIQLLLTDVVMPDMNGRDLAKQVQEMYPTIKTLYMSGYTANVIAHHGVLDEGVNFIQKPFSRSDLSIRIREILNLKV